ncbi:small ribosomal subunit protein uS11m isoform X3 [Macaca mulatta]
MQAVRNVGSWFLRSWTWPQTTGVVARTPARTIHTDARQLQDAAAKQEVEEKAAAPSHTRFRDKEDGEYELKSLLIAESP